MKLNILHIQKSYNALLFTERVGWKPPGMCYKKRARLEIGGETNHFKKFVVLCLSLSLSVIKSKKCPRLLKKEQRKQIKNFFETMS